MEYEHEGGAWNDSRILGLSHVLLRGAIYELGDPRRQIRDAGRF